MAESTAFPWLKHLPEDEQREFYEEILQISVTSHELGTPIPDYVEKINTCVAAWKATAEVHADPELKAALTSETGFNEGEFVEVERPEIPRLRGASADFEIRDEITDVSIPGPRHGE